MTQNTFYLYIKVVILDVVFRKSLFLEKKKVDACVL